MNYLYLIAVAISQNRISPLMLSALHQSWKPNILVNLFHWLYEKNVSVEVVIFCFAFNKPETNFSFDFQSLNMQNIEGQR